MRRLALLPLLLALPLHAQTTAPAHPDLDPLHKLRSLLIIQPPAAAPWKHFTFTDRATPRNVEMQPNLPVEEFAGFLLDQTPTTLHVLDWLGNERFLPAADTVIADETLQQTAAALQFPPPPLKFASDEIYIPKIPPPLHPGFLVAALLDQQGDHAAAAQILRNIAAADPSATADTAPTRLADNYRSAMFLAYGKGDYPRAFRLARHLASALFPDSPEKSFAAEFAAQLATRSADFTALTLPTFNEWRSLSKTLTRAQQIDLLSQRLHLITVENFSPADAVESQQYAIPPRIDPEDNFPKIVINPYNAFMEMHLTLAEAAPLVPRLRDNTFLINSTYDQNLPPSHPLPRVRELFAALINQAAAQTLVAVSHLRAPYDADVLLTLPQATEVDPTALAPLIHWLNDRAALPESQWLLESLRTVKSPANFFSLAQRAAVLHMKEAVPIILGRVDDFPTDSYNYPRTGIAMLLYHLDPAAAAPAARTWLSSGAEGLRFWAALILVHSRDPDADLAWPKLLGMVKLHPDIGWFPHAFPELLASSRPDARAAALSVLDNHEIMSWADPQEYVRRLLLAGYQEALDYDLALLNDSSPRARVQADEAVDAIARWPAGGNLLPHNRAYLRQWLTDQFALIRAGKPSAIAPPTRPLAAQTWSFPPRH